MPGRKRWGWKHQTERPSLPLTKFDRLTDQDLFVAAEQSMMNANAEFGRWPSEPDKDRKGMHLGLVETHLETALSAVQTMRRRHELRSGQ